MRGRINKVELAIAAIGAAVAELAKLCAELQEQKKAAEPKKAAPRRRKKGGDDG